MASVGCFGTSAVGSEAISVSGFKVFPNEVEAVVSGHPGVRECAAVGVPDSRTGEAVKLFVVKRDPSLTEQDIMEFCAKNLTNYKRPKQIEFRTVRQREAA